MVSRTRLCSNVVAYVQGAVSSIVINKGRKKEAYIRGTVKEALLRFVCIYDTIIHRTINYFFGPIKNIIFYSHISYSIVRLIHFLYK